MYANKNGVKMFIYVEDQKIVFCPRHGKHDVIGQQSKNISARLSMQKRNLYQPYK